MTRFARAHCGRVPPRTCVSFEIEYSILDFILACALHTCTSGRPSYIPTGPARAMLKSLGTRSPHIWFARRASAPQFAAAGQFECECPHSVRCIGSHSTSPRYLRLALVPTARDAQVRRVIATFVTRFARAQCGRVPSCTCCHLNSNSRF